MTNSQRVKRFIKKKFAIFSIIIVTMVIITAFFISSIAFRNYVKYQNITALNLTEIALWYEIQNAVFFVWGEGVGTETPLRLKTKIQSKLGDLLQKRELTHALFNRELDQLANVYWFSLLKKSDAERLKNHEVSPHINQIFHAVSTASPTLLAAGTSAWDTDQIVNIMSLQAFQPLTEKTKILEELKVQSVRYLWTTMGFVTTFMLIGLWVAWVKILLPTLKKMQNSLEAEQYEKKQRGHTQKLLSQHNKEFNLLLANIPIIVACVDCNRKFVFANNNIFALIKDAKQYPLLGKSIQEVLPATQMQLIESGLEKALEGQINGMNVVLDLFGKQHMTHVSFVPDKTDETPSRVFITVVDIDNDFKAEQALRDSEKNLSTILDSIGESVFVTDVNGIIKHINPIAEELVAYNDGNMIGTKLLDVIQFKKENSKHSLNILTEVLEKGVTITSEDSIFLHAPDNQQYPVSFTSSPIFDFEENVIGVVIVLRDISNEIKSQSQLAQLDKMQAIGQLVGGIAHDFNNLLAGILGSAEVLELREAKNFNPQNLKFLNSINTLVRRGIDLTQKLTAYSREGNIKQYNIDLMEIIDEVVEVAKSTIPKNIKVIVENKSKEFNVYGSGGTLQSAFLNLCLNAAHAIEGDGYIKFSIRNVKMEMSDLQKYPAFKLESGQYIEIKVEDNGSGIKPDDLPKIFDPFFTTKPVGEGSGLGLSAVYGVIQEHRGLIDVSSKVGEGTCFTARLPIYYEAEGEEHARKEKKQKPVNFSGNTLVVDDEAVLRHAYSEMLKVLGFNTISAENGKVAVERYDAFQGDFSCVLLDVNMPVQDGIETYKKLLKRNPKNKIIVLSGNVNSPQVKSLRLLGADTVLKKPFHIDELVTTLQEVI